MTSLDFAGYTASILFITAYYLNSKNSNLGKTWKFQLINIVAGTISIYYSYQHGAHASIFTNVIWILIALNSLKPLIKEKLTTSLDNKGVLNEKNNCIYFNYLN